MSHTEGSGVSARDLIWPIVVMFVALVLAIAGLAIFLPESRDITAIVTPLVATFTSLTVMIGGWVVVRRVADKVDRVAEVVENTAADTAEIREQTNGKLDARVRQLSYEAVRRALVDHLEDDLNPKATDRTPRKPPGDA